MINLHR